jgi:hypothetical protein
MNKIIFLDFDGVINIKSFERQFVDNLNFITDTIGEEAKIVISSTWRVDGLSECKNILRQVGVKGEVIGCLKGLYLSKASMIYDTEPPQVVDREYSYTIPRGIEVEYYLQENGYFETYKPFSPYRAERCNIDNFVILDDDNDFLITQQDHLVFCNAQYDEDDSISGLGLTKKAAEKAIEILSTK